jgi:hypothetical protein
MTLIAVGAKDYRDGRVCSPEPCRASNALQGFCFCSKKYDMNVMNLATKMSGFRRFPFIGTWSMLFRVGNFIVRWARAKTLRKSVLFSQSPARCFTATVNACGTACIETLAKD